jgi:hypothetical protein
LPFSLSIKILSTSFSYQFIGFHDSRLTLQFWHL